MTDPLCYELYLTILSLYEKYQILHSVINLLKVPFIIHCLFYLDTTYLEIGLICYLYWYMIKWQSYLQWIFLENHCSLFSLFQTVYIHEVLKMIQLLMFYCSWFFFANSTIFFAISDGFLLLFKSFSPVYKVSTSDFHTIACLSCIAFLHLGIIFQY